MRRKIRNNREGIDSMLVALTAISWGISSLQITSAQSQFASTSKSSHNTPGATALNPSLQPVVSPSTPFPSYGPSKVPTSLPTYEPTYQPSSSPTYSPTADPTHIPSSSPTFTPSSIPTSQPTPSPSTPQPTPSPSTSQPTHVPSVTPRPSVVPTPMPSCVEQCWQESCGKGCKEEVCTTCQPSQAPTTSTAKPSLAPSYIPSSVPSPAPSHDPTSPSPTITPSLEPTFVPSNLPIPSPTNSPTFSPSSSQPTLNPSVSQTPTREGAVKEAESVVTAGLKVFFFVCAMLLIVYATIVISRRYCSRKISGLRYYTYKHLHDETYSVTSTYSHSEKTSLVNDDKHEHACCCIPIRAPLPPFDNTRISLSVQSSNGGVRGKYSLCALDDLPTDRVDPMKGANDGLWLLVHRTNHETRWRLNHIKHNSFSISLTSGGSSQLSKPSYLSVNVHSVAQRKQCRVRVSPSLNNASVFEVIEVSTNGYLFMEKKHEMYLSVFSDQYDLNRDITDSFYVAAQMDITKASIWNIDPASEKVSKGDPSFGLGAALGGAFQAHETASNCDDEDVDDTVTGSTDVIQGGHIDGISSDERY